MLAAAAVLAGCLLLVAGALPPVLVRAGWPLRGPVVGLLVWQAVGLAGGLLALLLLVTLALAPLGPDHLAALRHLRAAGPQTVLLGLAAVALALRLLTVLLTSAATTARARHDNRVLVDLVAEPNLLLRGASVVDHEVPVAYCLPGLRSRVVLSRGALGLLSYDELRAVLAHERAHLAMRHDLVVLPFVALGATFPGLPPVCTARAAVLLLVEVLADDRAARHHDRTSLARALWKIGTGEAPTGALGLSGDEVLLRARRLLAPPAPLPPAASAAAGLLALAVAATPLLGLLVPYWV